MLNCWELLLNDPFGQPEIAVFSVNPKCHLCIDENFFFILSTGIEFNHTSSKHTALNLENVQKFNKKIFLVNPQNSFRQHTIRLIVLPP